jgi:hypothetical protein
MKNFEKNLEDASDEELQRWVNNYDFRVVPLASDELTRRQLKGLQSEIKNLESTIKKGNKTTEKAGEATAKFSKILILIGIIQFIVILFQFIYSVNEGENKIYGFISLFSVFVLIIYSFYTFNKKID